MFYVGEAGDNVREALKEEIERRIPALRVDVSSSSIMIEPAITGDTSVFVLESFFNSEADIASFRNLVDEAQYLQDVDNPQPVLQLPQAVLRPADENFPISEGISAVQTVISDIDLTRTWSRDQVNFSVEFPIFVGTRSYGDGTNVNKVMAADIGFNRPTFSQTTNSVEPYESMLREHRWLWLLSLLLRLYHQ